MQMPPAELQTTRNLLWLWAMTAAGTAGGFGSVWFADGPVACLSHLPSFATIQAVVAVLAAAFRVHNNDNR